MTCGAFFICALSLTLAAKDENTAEQRLSEAKAAFEQQNMAKSEEAARAALSLNPRMADALLVLALVETNRSDLKAAEQHLRKAAAIKPNDPRVFSYLGSTLLREKSYKDASSAFEKVLRLEPDDSVAVYNLGLIRLVQRKPLEALRYLQKTADVNTSDISAKMGILECRLMLNDQSSAERSASEIDALLRAGDPERLRLVAMLISYSRFQTAIPILVKLRDADPSSYDLNYNLALAYYRVARYRDAERTATDLIKLAPGPELFNLMGSIQTELQQYGAAQVDFQEAASRDPHNENYWIDYASALLEHGSIPEATAVWKSSKLQFPGSWRVHLGLGAALYLSGDYDTSADVLLQTVRLNPTARRVYSMLGKLYEAVPKRQVEIKQAFETYLHLNPKDAEVQCEYGRILYVSSRESESSNFASAKVALRKALALDPHLAEADLQLAIIDQSENHFQESLTLLSRALSDNPHLPEAHYRLAIAYRKSGQMDRAKAELQAFENLKLESRDSVFTGAIQHLTAER